MPARASHQKKMENSLATASSPPLPLDSFGDLSIPAQNSLYIEHDIKAKEAAKNGQLIDELYEVQEQCMVPHGDKISGRPAKGIWFPDSKRALASMLSRKGAELLVLRDGVTNQACGFTIYFTQTEGLHKAQSGFLREFKKACRADPQLAQMVKNKRIGYAYVVMILENVTSQALDFAGGASSACPDEAHEGKRDAVALRGRSPGVTRHELYASMLAHLTSECRRERVQLIIANCRVGQKAGNPAMLSHIELGFEHLDIPVSVTHDSSVGRNVYWAFLGFNLDDRDRVKALQKIRRSLMRRGKVACIDHDEDNYSPPRTRPKRRA